MLRKSCSPRNFTSSSNPADSIGAMLHHGMCMTDDVQHFNQLTLPCLWPVRRQRRRRPGSSSRGTAPASHRQPAVNIRRLATASRARPGEGRRRTICICRPKARRRGRCWRRRRRHSRARHANRESRLRPRHGPRGACYPSTPATSS